MMHQSSNVDRDHGKSHHPSSSVMLTCQDRKRMIWRTAFATSNTSSHPSQADLRLPLPPCHPVNLTRSA